MRNLKRALSLAMASIMLLGMMVMGASAATSYDDFSDKDKIVNTEAVKTMASLGVLGGRDTGDFDPAGVVTRAEMAKIIAFLRNGGRDPVLGTTVANFTDTKGHWAENYIAYCANQGILNGYGDGTFKPNATVTGTEAAKMILTALGYRSDIEKLTGANWVLNTDSLANKVGVYDGLNINPNEGLTRDNTAQMIYNGVQADEVEYRNNYGEYSGVIYAQPNGTMLWNRFKVVKVEGVVAANDVFGIGGYAPAQTNKSRFVNCNTYSTSSNGVTTYHSYDDVYPVSIANEYVGQRVVIYVKFQNALSPNAVDSVVIGTPIASEKNTVVSTGNKLKDADKVNSFLRDNELTIGTEATTLGNISDALRGVLTISDKEQTYAKGITAADGINAAGYKITFVDHTGDGTVDYIIKEQPKLAKVTVYNDTAKEMTIAGVGSLKFRDVANPEDVAKDDMVFYAKYGSTYYLSKPTTVTGLATAYDKANSKVVVEGTSYAASAVALTSTGTTLLQFVANDSYIGNTYVLYMDQFGYVVAYDVSEEGYGNYAVVIDAAGSSAVPGSLLNKGEVKLLMADGTSATYTVNLAASAGNFGIAGNTSAKEAGMATLLDISKVGGNPIGRYQSQAIKNMVVTYTVKDGKVTLGNPAFNPNYDTIIDGTAVLGISPSTTNWVQRSTASYNITSGKVDLGTGTAVVDGTTANGSAATATVLVNDTTTFFIRSGNNNTYVVNGLSKMPTATITGAVVKGAAYNTNTASRANVAKAVFVSDPSNSFKGSSEFVYIADGYTQTADDIRNNVYTYPAVFANSTKLESIKLSSTNATNGLTTVTVAAGNVYEYVIGNDGYAELKLTSNTINGYVTDYVRGNAVRLERGIDQSITLNHTLGSKLTVKNVEETSNIYDGSLSDALSVSVALDNDGFIALAFVKDSDVNFRALTNKTGASQTISSRSIANGSAIMVANGFTVTIGSGLTNGDKNVVYNTITDAGVITYNVKSAVEGGYGYLTMPKARVSLTNLFGIDSSAKEDGDTGSTTPGGDTTTLAPTTGLKAVNEALVKGNVVITGNYTNASTTDQLVVPANTTLTIKGNYNSATNTSGADAITGTLVVEGAYTPYDSSNNNTLSGTITAGSLVIGSGTATLTAGTRLTVNGAVTGTGTLEVPTDGRLNISGNVTGAIDSTGTTIVGGSVTGDVDVKGGTTQTGAITGDVTVADGELVAGAVTGTLTLTAPTAGKATKATVTSVSGTITDAAGTVLIVTGTAAVALPATTNAFAGKVTFASDVTLGAATTIAATADVTAKNFTGTQTLALNGKLTVDNATITTGTGLITLGAAGVLTINGTVNDVDATFITGVAGSKVIFGDSAVITTVTGSNFKAAGGLTDITTTPADYQGKTFTYVAGSTNAFVANA